MVDGAEKLDNTKPKIETPQNGEFNYIDVGKSGTGFQTDIEVFKRTTGATKSISNCLDKLKSQLTICLNLLLNRKRVRNLPLKERTKYVLLKQFFFACVPLIFDLYFTSTVLTS